MKRLILAAIAGCMAMAGEARTVELNDGWEFRRGDVKSVKALGDAGWTSVRLPHDFSIMDTGAETFSHESEGKNHTGHVRGGTAWYQRHYTVGKEDVGKHFTLYIDGAYMETEVYVNGRLVGKEMNGYVPFHLDITPYLYKPGKDNVIAIRVANEGKNSRWYSGSGLYRGVRLIIDETAYIPLWGVQVKTPSVSSEQAQVEVVVDATHIGDAKPRIDIVNRSTEQVVASSSSSHKFTIQKPALWSTEEPNLYEARIYLDGRLAYMQPFGLRTIEFSADRGFLLNGKKTILKGCCVHHDNGFLGAAAFRTAEYHRVKLLKDAGFNAIRCSHNPPSQYFLDACDEMGMLVIDEFTDMWTVYKNPQDYSRHFASQWEGDLTRMLLRDRNHPSIILWSIGNEIPKENLDDGAAWGRRLAAKVKELDGSRPVTEAVPSFLIHGGWQNTARYFDYMDVCGYNYMQKRYESDHAQYPQRIIYGSETYPKDAYTDWLMAERHPYVIGSFVWTGMDYIGEVNVANARWVELVDSRGMQERDGVKPGTDLRELFDTMERYAADSWPSFTSWCGDIDIIGNKKPQSLYRDIIWDRSQVELLVHEPAPDGLVEQVSTWGWPQELPSWNWPVAEGTMMDCRVMTKGDSVAVYVNDEYAAGKQLSEADRFIAELRVPYHKGTVKAIAYSQGSIIGVKRITTPGSPDRIRLRTDRSAIAGDGQDLAYINIDIVDDQGLLCDRADTRLSISVSGDGQLIASGNADGQDMESVNSHRPKAFRGQAQLIVRPTTREGRIVVSVSTDGLPTATDTIAVVDAEVPFCLNVNNVKQVVSALTIEEKAGLIGFNDMARTDLPVTVMTFGHYTFSVPRMGIPSVKFCDSPAGLTVDTLRASEPERKFFSTAWPVPTAFAASWNTDMAREFGRHYAREATDYGVDVILGPACNIHRNPLGGRSAEYYSEDPLLSGVMTAAVVEGIQSQGVGTSVKHFVGNEAETYRNVLDTHIPERALQEIYLRPYRMVIDRANPWTLMSSLNYIDGTYVAQSHRFMTDILRTEWGFQGMVMTDWFSGDDPVEQQKAGNDLMTPGTEEQWHTIIRAARDGSLPMADLDRNVERFLRMITKTHRFRGYIPNDHPQLRQNAQLSREYAAEGMVLLRNEKLEMRNEKLAAAVLPLNGNVRRVALFGNAAYQTFETTLGSGDVKKAYTNYVDDGLRRAGFTLDPTLKTLHDEWISRYNAEHPKHDHVTEMFEPTPPAPQAPVERALIRRMARQMDCAVIVIGRQSGEGIDRQMAKGDYLLDDAEQQLISDVSDAFHRRQKPVIVVLNIPAPIEVVSWRDRVDAILVAWLPGLEAGNAIADVLTGRVCPSGKLPDTWAARYDDIPSAKTFPGRYYPERSTRAFQGHPYIPGECSYDEGIYVGYRWFDREAITPAYPFGFGLSYTTFAYSDLQVTPTADGYDVSVRVTNTGQRSGKEAVQIYVAAPADDLDKPVQELRAFAKTRLLAPAASETLHMHIAQGDLASFCPTTATWQPAPGEYTFHAGASSRDLRLKKTIKR